MCGVSLHSCRRTRCLHLWLGRRFSRFFVDRPELAGLSPRPMAREGCSLTRWVVLLALLPGLTHAALELPTGVDRSPGGYLVLGLRQAKIKNLGVESPGCNVGVNCPASGASCGKLSATGATI